MSTDSPKPKRARHKTHKPPLSEQDIRFAQLLFARGKEKKSVTQCYLEAGFQPGKSDDATRTAAHEKLKNPHVRKFYRQLQERAADVAQTDTNRVAQGLARIAFFDLREVFDDRGRIHLPRVWSDAVTAGILSVKSEELFENVTDVDPETGKKTRRKELVGYTREVKRVAPTEALKILAQVLRLIGTDSVLAEMMAEIKRLQAIVDKANANPPAPTADTARGA